MYTYIYIEACAPSFSIPKLLATMDLASPYAPIELTCCFNEAEQKKSPRMDSPPSQSMQWTSYLLKSYQEIHSQSGIRHQNPLPRVPFTRPTFLNLSMPLDFSTKLDFWRALGETFRWSFPTPETTPTCSDFACPDFKGLPFPIVRRQKYLNEKIWKEQNLPPPRRLHL